MGTLAASGRSAARRGRVAALSVTAVSVLSLTAPAPAPAASAGLKPSEAPLVSVGQHNFGSARHVHNANWNTVEFWRLPPLLSADAVTVAWNAPGYEPPTFCLAHDIDDYNFAEEDNLCNGSQMYGVTSSGSARSVVEAAAATSNAFLEFWGNGCDNNCAQPYDFVIESIQHAIGVGLNHAPKRIRPRSKLTASANLSNGAPVPDGLAFTLTATWVTPVNKASHHRDYVAASGGGSLAFQLSLPRSARGRRVSLVVARPADPGYLEAKSARATTKVIGSRKRHHRR